VGVIGGRDAPRITSADALAAVEVIETAYASAAQQRWLPVGAAS